MKKWMITVFISIILCCICIGCGKDEAVAPTEAPTVAPTEAPTQVPEETKQEESIKEIQEEEIVEGIVERIPVKDTYLLYTNCGKIEEITYQTKDYYGDGSEITKTAFVYLPKDYDETKQYNVLYLMHGIGGDEKEWGIKGGEQKWLHKQRFRSLFR